MNKPDPNHRRRWKRRSLLIVAVILLPIVAYMAWTNRPLSSEEQRLVGSWSIRYDDERKQLAELRSGHIGESTYGEGYVSEFDWRVRNGQLVFVPYAYRSQEKSMNNLYRHCVLVMESIAMQTPYPADTPQHYSMQWIDDDTLKLTAASGSNIPTGLTVTMHREPK